MRSRLILILKFPQSGAVKTRLIPALGQDRACELYRALVRQTLDEVAQFAMREKVGVEARVSGSPTDEESRAWLGEGVTIKAQGEGDLGQRMERAVEDAFAEGIEAVALIGGDCPPLSADHLSAAFSALARGEIVLGPAEDGGYYLIGLRRPYPQLFRGITWSSPEVFAQTLAVAHALKVAVTKLETLRDVDVPDDLAFWAQTAVAREAGRGGVSVVIPTLDEERVLTSILDAVQSDRPHEVIVVDGGSADRTLERARASGCIALEARRGRAAQLNYGAAVATGEYLLFVHADTRLPPGYSTLVRATLAPSGVVAGAFEFAIDGDFPGRRLIEWGTNIRARRWQMPYGDQGIFLKREMFVRVGGFSDLPIMEDYEFVQRLRRWGSIALAPASVRTSGRRWQRLGPLRTTLINQLMVLGFKVGISPQRLARWYRPRHLRERELTSASSLVSEEVV